MQYSPFFASFIKHLTQEADSPMDTKTSPRTHRPPVSESPPPAVRYLQRGLRHICCSRFLREPAAFAGEAAHCWDGGLCLGVRPRKSLPFHCRLMLFLKRCSGISLISYAIIGIKKAARKLGNRFLGVKDKKVNTMTARGIPIWYPDITRGKLALFLSVTLL